MCVCKSFLRQTISGTCRARRDKGLGTKEKGFASSNVFRGVQWERFLLRAKGNGSGGVDEWISCHRGAKGWQLQRNDCSAISFAFSVCL